MKGLINMNETVHTTIRIPKEWDDKIKALVDEINADKQKLGVPVDHSQAKWIRDAIKKEIKNQTPIDENIKRYNELYEMFNNSGGVKVYPEVHDLWDRLKPIFKHRTAKELYDMFHLQNKINYLLEIENSSCEMSNSPTRYEVQSVNVGGQFSNLEVYLQPINPTEPYEHYRLRFDFDGAYWGEDIDKHRCRCKECIDKYR